MPHAEHNDLTSESCFLSLGSNVGDREGTILRAIRLLESERIVDRVRVSSLYQTEPVGCATMNDFVNAVAEVQPLHLPGDLLKRLQAVERLLGRSGGHNEPRELDIDLITYGRLLLRADELTVPHPRFATRRFVLLPLAELAPAFRCPETGAHIDRMIRSLPADDRVEMISSRRIVWA